MLIEPKLDRGPQVILHAEHLLSRCWCFGHGQTFIYAPFMRFGAGGRLIGYRHQNENSWAIIAGKVALLDETGVPTTIFDRASLGDDGRLLLVGRHRDGRTTHFLREIEGGAGPAVKNAQLDLIQRRTTGRRRNLVVLRANETSLHPTWERDVDESSRSWDLCISYYGNADSFPPDDFAEYACLQNEDRKFTALRKLMHRGSILWDYDYIMFPDDDLQMKWSDLNVLFSICHEFGLQLAQPSLNPDSIINHETTKQKTNFLLRFVTMVEIMAPIFSQAALRACIHTFDLNRSGFGIDYAWSKLVDGPLTQIAVIDRVAVEHTRPTGQSYNLGAAIDEGYDTADKFGFLDQCSMRELGCILAHKSVEVTLIDPAEGSACVSSLEPDDYGSDRPKV